MQLNYHLKIENPSQHKIKVIVAGKRQKSKKCLRFFLPSWSPGSYLMREYAKNIIHLAVQNSKGEYYFFQQISKNTWEIDFDKEQVSENETFEIIYELYCHEIGVRNSFIDETHAFLHGPAIYMGIEGEEILNPTVELTFPALWSKVSTSLKDIGGGPVFKYTAENYDELLDCPIEIGCHETDGFRVNGIDHHLCFYGYTYKSITDLKTDMKKVAQYIADYIGDIPFDQYYFITHFGPGWFGGLEHSNNTVLQFDGRTLNNRDDYLEWLALVSHEYFHAWNVKRIRPIELGPFDYSNENYTKMLWLAEGMTSFFDQYFVYKSGLCNENEYCSMLTKNFQRYFKTLGRKYQSVEDSSFNAWIRLYRPDENSNNAGISYYLKGGILFLLLHIRLLAEKKSLRDLLLALWKDYLAHPERGITSDEFFDKLEVLAGKSIRDEFELWITTTDEPNIEMILAQAGLELDWKQSENLDLGVQFKYVGDRGVVSQVQIDSSAYKSGLCVGDEIIAINGQRFLQNDLSKLDVWLVANKTYLFKIARNGTLYDVEIHMEKKARELKSINISYSAKFKLF